MSGLALCLWVGPPAAGATELPSLRAERPPFFHADLTIALDAHGRPTLNVGLSVPYEELQWVKLPNGFGAGAGIAVVFRPGRGAREYGGTWERRLVVGTFAETNSNVAALSERRSFDLPPGRYEARVTLTDVNSGTTSDATRTIDMPDYSNIPVGIAGLELGVVDSTGAFEPVPGRRYGSAVERLAARIALFDRRPGDWPRRYAFKYRVLSESGQTLRQGQKQVMVQDLAEPPVLRPDSTSLFVGAYELEIELLDTGSRWRVERTFEVEHSGPPVGRELDALIEPLGLIATSEEVDSLDAVPPAERAVGWERFWKRRDPTPDTPRNEAMLEFLNRVRYADRNFRELGPGWRSDRGRIYIRYGAPDQVESRPAGIEGRPLELWYYNRPYRRFVFVDRDGFGHYALVSPWVE